MGKVKVKVLNAVVDGHKEGAIISVDEKSAKHLASINYVAPVAEEKKVEQKKEDGK